VGFGKRMWDVARANATDFASAFTTDPEERARRRLDAREASEGLGSVGSKAGRRARTVADKAEEAWERAFEEARAGGPVGGHRGQTRRQIDGWYRTLEIPTGSDLGTVRKAYRKLVAKYHPDRFANDPEKYAAATEFVRKITDAYDGLKQLNGV